MFYKKGDQATVLRDSYSHDFHPGTVLIIHEVRPCTKTYLAFPKADYSIYARYVPERDLRINPKLNSQAQHLLSDTY